MKIAYISDLHIDFNNHFNIYRAIVNWIKENKPDLFLIGGDISNSTATSLSFVNLVQNATNVPTHFIFGNHDYYLIDKDFHTDREKQNTFPLIIGDVGIVADTGWYDYSWYTPGFGKSNRLRRGKFGYGNTWPDHRFIKWPEEAEGKKDGAWFFNHTLNELKKQNDVVDSAGVSKKIIMNHMIPHEDFASQNFDHLETNVFFGSYKLSHAISNMNPDVVLFGHTHFTFDKIKDDTWYVCSPLGYNFEWSSANVEKEIDRKLIMLEV